MIDPEEKSRKLLRLLDGSKVEYKLFEHRAASSYEDLAIVRKETGFIGTEGKCLVMKADENFIVYVTLQGKRVNFEKVKEKVGAKKVRLALPDELKEYFGAEPGCAYPFGFGRKYDIFVDPEIYSQEWVLFSPVLPTRTVQAKGADLKKVFASLSNKVTEVVDFNL